jgi:hypothetical protein
MIEIDLEHLDEDSKWEFYELAFESIKYSYNQNQDEALICEIEDENNPDESEFLFLDKTQWFDFCESCKEFFTEQEEYEYCAEIVKFQQKLLIPNIIESLKKK